MAALLGYVAAQGAGGGRVDAAAAQLAAAQSASLVRAILGSLDIQDAEQVGGSRHCPVGIVLAAKMKDDRHRRGSSTDLGLECGPFRGQRLAGRRAGGAVAAGCTVGTVP